MGRLKPAIPEPTAAANLRNISRGIMETLAYSADKKSVFLARYLRPERSGAGFTGLRGTVRAPLQVLMALAHANVSEKARLRSRINSNMG